MFSLDVFYKITMLSESIPYVNCVNHYEELTSAFDERVADRYRHFHQWHRPCTDLYRVFPRLVVTVPLQASYMSRNTELSSQITGIRRVDRVNSLFSSQETKEKKIKSQQRTRVALRRRNLSPGIVFTTVRFLEKLPKAKYFYSTRKCKITGCSWITDLLILIIIIFYYNIIIFIIL